MIEVKVQKIVDFQNLNEIKKFELGQNTSKILNDEGLMTPRGTTFKNNHVHSIYKKGNIRVERMNRKDNVDISDVVVEVLDKTTWYKLFQ